MLLAKEMGAQSLLAKSDSQLVTGQVTGEYQAKDPQMAAYLRYVEVLKRAFAAFELVHVSREQNARAGQLRQGGKVEDCHPRDAQNTAKVCGGQQSGRPSH